MSVERLPYRSFARRGWQDFLAHLHQHWKGWTITTATLVVPVALLHAFGLATQGAALIGAAEQEWLLVLASFATLLLFLIVALAVNVYLAPYRIEQESRSRQNVAAQISTGLQRTNAELQRKLDNLRASYEGLQAQNASLLTEVTKFRQAETSRTSEYTKRLDSLKQCVLAVHGNTEQPPVSQVDAPVWEWKGFEAIVPYITNINVMARRINENGLVASTLHGDRFLPKELRDLCAKALDRIDSMPRL